MLCSDEGKEKEKEKQSYLRHDAVIELFAFVQRQYDQRNTGQQHVVAAQVITPKVHGIDPRVPACLEDQEAHKETSDAADDAEGPLLLGGGCVDQRHGVLAFTSALSARLV